jgi:hypothetical protein
MDILAVAYSDIDGLDGYSTGDVLIARLMDTSGDGAPGPGDIVDMGKYPTNLDASAFGDWLDPGHAVANVLVQDANLLFLASVGGGGLGWSKDAFQEYYEEALGGHFSSVLDGYGAPHSDRLIIDAGSPSAPKTSFKQPSVSRYTDDAFVDVVLNYPAQ